MLLAHYVSQHPDLPEDEAIRLATKKYVEIRRPRVKRIPDGAKQMGDMECRKGRVEEWITYSFIRVRGRLGEFDGYKAFLLKDLPMHEVRRFVDAGR